MNSKLIEVQNQCLDKVKQLLDKKIDLSDGELKSIRELVNIALEIEEINLHWNLGIRLRSSGPERTSRASQQQ